MLSFRDAQIDSLFREVLGGFRPPPALSVSAWADAHRVLGSGSPLPGRWSTRNTPFLKEPMDCLSPSHPCEMVVMMKSAQVGASECLLNTLGFYLEHSPCPILVVEPTTESMKRFSRHRIEPLISSTPALRAIIRDPRSRDARNTIFLKQTLNGAVLVMTGANSSVGLRSTPVRVLLADEIDAWPLDIRNEGDPFQLALQRTTAFTTQRKVFAISTPTIENFSRIAALYAWSDQRKFFVPCPFCRHMQILVWENVRWEERKPETAHYVCVSCGESIQNYQKVDMLPQGEWRPSVPANGRVAGFHISQLYAPPGWPSWPDLAREWLEAQKSREVLQVFCNTVLAETWKDEQTQPVDADTLFSRREPYPCEIPMGATLLTAGVDCQADRLECEIVGWGRGEESWSIVYVQLWGDPGEPQVWQELDRLLLRGYKHQSGFELHISAACIDAGFLTAEVLEFCRPRFNRKIWATRGQSGFGRPIFPRRSQKHSSKNLYFMIGVDSCKERVFSKLRIETPGSGYAHFPISRDREYFTQLTSERIATRFINGHPARTWVKSPSARNESLDVRVYATAALFGLFMHGVDLNRHCTQFELMCDPGSGGAAPSGYEIVRSKWMS